VEEEDFVVGGVDVCEEEDSVDEVGGSEEDVGGVEEVVGGGGVEDEEVVMMTEEDDELVLIEEELSSACLRSTSLLAWTSMGSATTPPPCPLSRLMKRSRTSMPIHGRSGSSNPRIRIFADNNPRKQLSNDETFSTNDCRLLKKETSKNLVTVGR
jgi:hypothetical protein